MPVPMQWLGSCKLQSAAAAPRPLQQQQQHAVQHSSSSSHPCSSTSSTSSYSSTTHRSSTAAAAAPTTPSSCNSSSLHLRTVTASAAVAAAGAFPLPEPASFHKHSRAPLSSSSSSSSSSSASASASAAVDALTGVPPQGWQISTHIRHSVEEAMKASMSGMGFVHLPHHPPYAQHAPPQQQQQQQQQQQEEGVVAAEAEQQEEEQQQQQHAAWQQLVLDMGQVEAQQSTASLAAAPATVAAAAAAASAADRTDNVTITTSNSSGVLLAKSTQQIQACKSAGDLDQLLQANWQHMDHIHVASAFVQLARIQQQQQQQQGVQQEVQSVPVQAAPAAPAAVGGVQGFRQENWAKLQQVALQQLSQLQSRQCANILWACASCSLKPSDTLLLGLLARSQTLLQQGTTPQGFANMIWGLATLRVQPSGAWLDAFFSASQQQLYNFQPQELSSTIWALAQLRQQPPRDWYAAFLTASAAKLGACSAQSLCNQLWGVARLGLAVPDYWWSALTYACSVRAGELTPAGVCQVLWGAGMVAGKQQRRRQQQHQQQGLGQQQQRGKQVWGYLSEATTSSSSSSRSISSSQAAAAVQSTQWLEPLLAAVEPQLQQLNSTAVSSLLWALAVMGHNPGTGFVSKCLSCMASKGGLGASNAVHALWAASSLAGKCVGAQQMQPLLVQLQQQGMQGCKPQEFVYVAAALANMSKKQQQQQQQQEEEVPLAQPDFQQQQQQGLPQLPPLPADPQGGVPGVDSTPHTTPPVNLVDSLAQQLLSASKPQLQRFHLGQLSQLGRWLVAAGVRPNPSWVDSFLAATAPYLHTLQPGQQLLLLHAVQHWGTALQPGWVALFLGACTSELALQQYTAGHVGALLQAFAAAKLQPQPHHLKQLLQRVLQPGAQLDAAAVAAVMSGLLTLGFRPPDGWVQQFWAAGAAAVVRAGSEGLTAVAGLLQHQGIWELSLRPNRPFAAAYQTGIAAVLPQLQPQQAAAMLAGLTAARMHPTGQQQQQQHLMPGLMAVAVKGLYSMPLSDVVAAWWGLVRPRVLCAAVPLEHLSAPAPAAAAAAQAQDQQWLQQQWQALWLRRIFSSCSSSSSAGQLAQLQPVSLLQLADCMRRLQQQVPGIWADAYLTVASVHILRLTAHELHLLLHALPCFDGAAALPEFAEKLIAAAEPQLQEFSPSQLSDVLYSIQQAGLKPSESWLNDYITTATAHLPQFWPRQLTRVLTALARLRFMPDASFLSAAMEAAVDHLPRYRVHPGEMVDLLWAIVALRVRPSAAWMARFEGRLLERGPEQLDGQQLSRLGWCLSALQRKPGRVLWAKWLAATQQQMPSMDGSSLSDTLWTCAMLDEQPSRAWLDTFTSSSQQHLHTFSSSTLVTVVWSLALLQHRPHSDWMLSCFAALSRCFTSSSSSSSSSHALQQQQQQQQGECAVHAVHAEPLGPAQVTRVSWALAALDCQLPSHFSVQLLQLSLQHVPQLDADSLAQLVWAWDKLDGTQDKQYVQQIAAAARAQLMPHAGDPVMGVVDTGMQGSYISTSSSSSSGGSGFRGFVSGNSADVALQRPVARVRLGQQRVVLRHSSSSRAVVVSQQQQQFVGALPQRGLFGVKGKLKLGGRQQLMATLQRIYASDMKPSNSNSNSSSSSSSSSSADAEMSLV